ncbi:hypothetical protein CHS0354_005520 [Potamilus streckersoni]|uniref:Zinc finger PHD-type domain-containing protein n=1 Tax=Potamilus streckersoni TaxID=2493646 RepID=A0AAE0RYG8_9BIVA|nr:hypothetical protein CHS0354_005520 [Potamilus streckersoni]
MQYSCIWCTKKVTTRQQAVEYDCCHRWQHMICDIVFQEALKLGRLTYVCSTCVRTVGVKVCQTADDNHKPPMLKLCTSVAVNASYNEEPPALELNVSPIAESTQMDADAFLESTLIDNPGSPFEIAKRSTVLQVHRETLFIFRHYRFIALPSTVRFRIVFK